MNVCIRITLALLVPALAYAQTPDQVARDVNPDPNFEARYCAFLSANKFSDHAANLRWAHVIVGLEQGRSLQVRSDISRDAFALMQQVDSQKAQADYQKCNARLAIAEAMQKKNALASLAGPTPSPPASTPLSPKTTDQEDKNRAAIKAFGGGGLFGGDWKTPKNSKEAFNAQVDRATGEEHQAFKDSASKAEQSLDRASDSIKSADKSRADLNGRLVELIRERNATQKGTQRYAELQNTIQFMMQHLGLSEEPKVAAENRASEPKMSASSSRQKKLSNSYHNPYAPPRLTDGERKEMNRTGDVNRLRELLDKDHTWFAYCVVASDALYRLSEQNPSTLGFDPAKVADKQVIESIAEWRKQVFSLFQSSFKKDQELLAREYVQKQLANYNKGMDQHRSSAGEIGLYVKAQSSECDAAFGVRQGLARDDIKNDPFYQASYCQYTATAFNDKEMAKAWSEIATDLITRGLVKSASEMDDLAFDLAPLQENDEDRPLYEQCRERLTLVRKNAQTARSPVNAYAPARVAWYDRTEAARLRFFAKTADATTAAKSADDLANAMNKIRAWDAYCFMSGQSLATMIEHNPSGFGLDLRKPEHAELLQAVKSETANFKAQYEKDFSASERSQMQAFFDPQRDNYGKGYFERKHSDNDVVEYAKRQVFECSQGFEQIWASMAR